MALERTLRQKTWGVFIKPYLERAGENVVIRGSLYCNDPFTAAGFTAAKGGVGWMLHQTATSFAETRDIVKTVMDDLGYSKNDILVTEIIPVDHIVTPLA